MCGIAGFWAPGFRYEDAVRTLSGMTGAISHRGPDDEGHWIDPDSGVALGHRRLSILDLSAAGHQPMRSASGRYLLVFNGEIYNWKSLRTEEELYGARWRGHSDTEVLLAAIERLGVGQAVERAVGMFAFVVWDRERRQLWLARDRLGEKPLYYGVHGGVFLFGSELKALRAHPAFRPDVDPGAVALYLRHNYIPAPWSIYRGIQKLEPGTTACLTYATTSPTLTAYWSAREHAAAGLAAPFCGGDELYLEALDARLQGVVRDQMVADVPLGAFLSGGVDSSLIVALMQRAHPRPVRTFTIRFEEQEWDEGPYARAVANHLGTEHTELTVTPRDLLGVVPRLPAMYDEPFADSSQVPTALVAEVARRHVVVAVSGDGGDELFGGYLRYGIAEHLWRRIVAVPRPFRRAAGGIGSLLSPGFVDWVLTPFRPLLPRVGRRLVSGDRFQKLAGLLSSGSFEEFYREFVSHWRRPGECVPGALEPLVALADPRCWLSGADPLPQMMYLDSVSYLPDDILVKVDRAAMAVGLESRAPLLDHRVFELAWRMPAEMRSTARGGKAALKRLLTRYVPRELTERPKMGFGVPVRDWLRGPLRGWGADLLDARRLSQDGIFDAAVIEAKWREHQSGTHDWHAQLWAVLMYQSWRLAR